MYKIILADDNPLIRMGMKSMIRWKELKAELVGEAGDGEEALELLKNYEADLVITDIRMPGKDGLYLIQEIKKRYPKTETIIISAYNEFAYAKEALRAGCIDYVLKPIDPEEINNAIGKAIEKRKEKEPEDCVIELGEAPALVLLKTESNKIENIREAMEKYPLINIRKEKQYFIISFDQSEYSVERIETALRKQLGDNILYGKAIADGRESIENLIERAKFNAGRNFLKKAVYEQTGIVDEQIKNMQQGIEDIIIFCKSGNNKKAKEIYSMESRHIWLESQDNIEIWQKNMERFLGRLVSLETDCGAGEVLKKISRQKEELSFISPKEMDMELEACMDRMCNSYRIQHWGKKEIVKAAMEYIERCYGEELSLSGIAEKLHITAPYLSKIFKEESGKNLNQYITEIRVEKAQSLLENSNRKVVEIAEMVGYDDVNYFTKVYKKITGKTPAQDRKL